MHIMEKLFSLFTKFCLLLVIKSDVFAVQTICFKNIKVKEKYATTLTLTWEFSCSNISINAYKIYYQHEDWLACPDKKSDTRNTIQKSGLFVVTNETNTVMLNTLHPYSEYKVTIKAVTSNFVERYNDSNPINRMEAVRYFNTSQFFPGVHPELLRHDDVNEDNDTILFTWSPPSFLKCSNFNGKIIGYQYEFKFADGCNLEKEESGGMGDPIYEFFKDDPIVNYTLLVYAENELGEINTQLPLIINGSSDDITTIKKYYTPQNINAIVNDTVLEICWSSLCDEGMGYLIRLVIDQDTYFIIPNNIKDLRINDVEFTILYRYCIELDENYPSFQYIGNFSHIGVQKISQKHFSWLLVEVIIDVKLHISFKM